MISNKYDIFGMKKYDFQLHLLWCQCWSQGIHWQPPHSHQKRPEQWEGSNPPTFKESFCKTSLTLSLLTVQLVGASAQHDCGSFPKWNSGGPSIAQSEEFFNPQQWNSDWRQREQRWDQKLADIFTFQESNQTCIHPTCIHPNIFTFQESTQTFTNLLRFTWTRSQAPVAASVSLYLVI